MTCLSELTCAVYVDGELSPEETRAAERHLTECPRCRALVGDLRDENRALSAALGDQPALAPSPAGAARLMPTPGRSSAATSDRRNRAWGLTVAALVGAGSRRGPRRRGRASGPAAG